MQGQAGLLVQGGRAHGQGFGVAAVEVLGEMHAVIGAQRLFAEYMDLETLQSTIGDQLLDTVVADHAVADDDEARQVRGGG